MYFATATIMLLAMTMSEAHPNQPIIDDPLINMYKQQELLMKSIQQMLQVKFADLEQKILIHKNEVNTKLGDLKTRIDKIPICPLGYHENAYGCYKFVTTKMTYDEAKANCTGSRVNAHLVIIDSAGEQAALITLMQEKGIPTAWYRIGGKQVNNWIWEATNTKFSYTNWQSEYPDKDTARDCVELRYHPNNSHHGKWANFGCSGSEYFICEIQP